MQAVIIDKHGMPIGQTPTPRPSAAYGRGVRNPNGTRGTSSMLPYNATLSLRDPNEDVRAVYDRAAAGAVDAAHNNGWIAGVRDIMVGLIVGEGLRLSLSPDFSWAGWSEQQTAEWARLAERRFRVWSRTARYCDAWGRHTFGQMQGTLLREWFVYGEAVATIETTRRRHSPWRTCVRLVPTHWLKREDNSFDGLMQGVYLNAEGAPSAYLLEVRDPRTNITQRVRRLAYDRFGRTLTVHVHDGAPGQVRGISPLATVLRVLQSYDQMHNVTLTAALLQTMLAATITSEYPTADVLSAMGGADESQPGGGLDIDRFGAFMDFKADWHENVDIDLGVPFAKMAHLMPGEKVDLNGTEHPNSNFEAFQTLMLREIAKAVGATYEDLTGDFRGATYSSVRMSIAKQWPLLLARRRSVVQPFCQAGFEAWLEEEIDAGTIPFPGGIDAFTQQRAMVCQAEWRGPAKPQADENKAQKALEGYQAMGVMSATSIAAEIGLDLDEEYAKLAYELRERERYGLPEPATLAAAQSPNGDETAPDDGERRSNNGG